MALLTLILDFDPLKHVANFQSLVLQEDKCMLF